MIRLQKLVPSVYYNHSRDFQFIGRLYDLVLNAVKTNADLLYNLPLNDDSDDRWLDLTSTTLGLELKNYYNVKQLKAICGSFAEVIKNKGNLQSIEKACNILMHAEGIPETVYIEQSEDLTELIVHVSNKLSDTALLRDLLTYILPAGTSCRIVKTNLTLHTASEGV